MAYKIAYGWAVHYNLKKKKDTMFHMNIWDWN